MALTGLAAGTAAGLGWRLLGRPRWGALPFVVAALAAARYAGRTDWPRWDGTHVVAAVVVALAALGAARLLALRTVGWEPVAAGALVSAAGVWAGVPETGPVLLAGGVLTGLAATAWLTGARWGRTAGVGAAALLGWAALSGATGRPWAAMGGALCTGMAPWFALRRPTRATAWSRRQGLAVLGAHAALAVAAARWIGVDPQAGWGRVAVLAAAGLAVAGAARRRA